MKKLAHLVLLHSINSSLKVGKQLHFLLKHQSRYCFTQWVEEGKFNKELFNSVKMSDNRI